VELDAAQLPRTLDDVLASVINSNFAGQAGFIPSRDAIIMEDKDSPYANIIVVREADKDSPKIKAWLKPASPSRFANLS
jgi:ABC-type metal ion transport system, periplasmic component/surface antigen